MNLMVLSFVVFRWRDFIVINILFWCLFGIIEAGIIYLSSTLSRNG